MGLKERLRLKPKELTFRCNPALFSEKGKRKPSMESKFIGQDRAIESIKFGLSMRGHGFNIYVAGLPGLGKETIVKAYLNRVAVNHPPPSDWCYVYNFDQPDRPIALRFATGEANLFASDMADFIDSVRSNITKALNSAEFKEEKARIIESLEKARVRILQRVNERIKKYGMILQTTEQGLMPIPAIDGEPIQVEQYRSLTPEQREQLAETNKMARPDVNKAVLELQQLDKKGTRRLAKIIADTIDNILRPLFEDIMRKYRGQSEVTRYLKRVQDDIFRNAGELFPEANLIPPEEGEVPEDGFSRYGVNVFIDNSKQEGAPVISEPHPSYYNLFGRVEHRAIMGTLVTDFTMIKPGSLHRANGGYLVIHASDLLRKGFSYDALKRSIRNREIQIEDPREALDLTVTEQLRPEPIPLELKVILVGSQNYYYLLREYDEEFRKLFKVKSEFDTEIDISNEIIKLYGDFVRIKCADDKLPQFNPQALSRMVEHSARLASSKNKLSTQFSEISDIIREAANYAVSARRRSVRSEDVEKAIMNHHRRFSLYEDKLLEAIADGTIMVATSGKEVGQVNGLAVYDLSDIEFGKPSRITVSVSIGRQGVVDIEREARLGGRIHTKGVLILKSFLTERFSKDFQLSVNASICFEQNYGGIDGDSASAAELFTLLSAISGVPIDQGIAITGSINQKGEIQAIGGVNEKVEGFFSVCKAQKLTGKQGVLIPKSNVQHLVLSGEILKAVERGKFHIWAMETAEEGIEILTGMKAGSRNKKGKYPAGTLFHLVEKALFDYAKKLNDFGKEEKKNKGNTKEKEEDQDKAKKRNKRPNKKNTKA